MHRCLLSALGLVALILSLPATALAEGPSACAVDKVEGDDARAWSAGAWSPVVAGMALATDAKIVTGVATRVRILCDNATVVTIGTETELNLESLAMAGGHSRSVAMQIVEGIVGLVMPQRYRGGFQVRTPVAIASVRSTEWLIEWHAGDSAAVFVRRGAVGVRVPAAGRRFVIKDGEGITVAADGTAGPVKTWGAARIAKSTGRLGFDWQ